MRNTIDVNAGRGRHPDDRCLHCSHHTDFCGSQRFWQLALACGAFMKLRIKTQRYEEEVQTIGVTETHFCGLIDSLLLFLTGYSSLHTGLYGHHGPYNTPGAMRRKAQRKCVC